MGLLVDVCVVCIKLMIENLEFIVRLATFEMTIESYR